MLTNLIVAMTQHPELLHYLKTAVIATENLKKGGNKAVSLHKDAEDYVRKFGNLEVKRLKADEESRLCSPIPRFMSIFRNKILLKD